MDPFYVYQIQWIVIQYFQIIYYISTTRCKNSQEKFPRDKWSKNFRNVLINDYSFYSARVEDNKLQYGDTIRFLNDESVRGINLDSLLGISEHQSVLKTLLANLDNFKLTEEIIKNVHANLMGSPLAWETDFKPELVGNY